MKALILLFLLLNLFPICAQTNLKDEQLKNIDFKTTSAAISILPESQLVKGNMKYIFEILQDTDTLYLDANDMEFENVRLNGKEINYFYNDAKLLVINNFKTAALDTLTLEFEARPTKAMYFINWDYDGTAVQKEVWTQGQGKNTSNWMPLVDDMREKTVYDLKINFKNGYEVIANGVLKDKLKLNDSITQWHYSMEKPMSSYLLGIAIGNYKVDSKVSASNIPLELYYNPIDSSKVESTYRHSTKIFDFLEKEIGVAYPWNNYKQIPVQDFLYAGMENTGTTFFSNMLMVDAIGYNDRNYVSVNAHELAHQWFGDLVTERSGKDHWLQEGFATYYALLVESDIFGEDYYYWKLYESAEQLKSLSDQGKGEVLLSSTGSSLTYYQKGAWALHILRERVGDTVFRKAIINYLEKYAFKTVSTDDFINEVELVYGKKLENFKKNWLQQSAFQGTTALNSLKKSKFINDYLKIAALRETPLLAKKEMLSEALDFPVNDYVGQEVVYQLSGEKSVDALELYRKAFKSGNLYVRQAIAISMKNIPEGLKKHFESLLKDDSYLTKENALMELWLRYPENIEFYLKSLENVDGFSNKNVRLLWLTLNLVNPQIDKDKASAYYDELSGYTYPTHPFELRQNTFGYLYQINAFSNQNLMDLLEGAQHHNYRFRAYCRELLDKLLENQEYREKYVALKDTLSKVNREFLNKKLKI